MRLIINNKLNLCDFVMSNYFFLLNISIIDLFGTYLTGLNCISNHHERLLELLDNVYSNTITRGVNMRG
jgi:hypothetical protein